MSQNAEAEAFFATRPPRLVDIHVGLVDVFAAPTAARTTRARIVPDDASLAVNYVLPFSGARRRKEGASTTVPDLNAFKKSWGIFTEGSLSQLTDWNNVVAAGGSVLACLSPLPDAAKATKRTMRKYFHETALPFLRCRLVSAERKIVAIYEAVRDSVPWDVTCVRTKHTVSIHSHYPYRCTQIVLRLYRSSAEILAGFDVDAPCCAYDGARVWASPRALVAMIRQCNTVDVARRSPSYEARLAKYAARDFEVYVPALRRADVGPTGLARLLVLEKLSSPESRAQYLAERGTLRGRPTANTYRAVRRARQYKGDLKSSLAGGRGGVLEMSDYETVALHVPYGPGWDAKRIEKLVFKTDLRINTPFNPKNKGRRLHRHPAFFGTMEECLNDCCGHCPEPRDAEEHQLRNEEDKSCIRGRVAFIAEDPGRQTLSGSFNPISDGEWSEQAYILSTARLFAAIAGRDRPAVRALLSAGARHDVDRRDHVGRTPLHVAVLSDAGDIACDLVDVGARMSARLVGGCSAQRDMTGVVKKMLLQSSNTTLH
ncbi:hypothetical protein HETIRDRAFT_425946 [Heterobasidion irregulare TC 32-1]|uniref:Uncharacterized protein n=1 Tax=Heterobasidion irregulare (strain TC 32-1) TaxID=747525 RepID=W4KFR9_HETIT|nr:uncharacterized protein HETIRDRAFT_425946 [Heterobasidion irregulare TC 32-1]ETW84697.1 hypothetical protein HETIRDRAFT_425946 [Heterobasidion irregulare TC 32-1]